MRTTTRSSRQGSPTHNDRSFMEEKPKQNVYGSVMRSEHPDKTFEEIERLFYQKYYQKGLEAKNQRYKAQGHSERCKTIDDLYRGDKTCPSETLFQIGNMDKCPDPKILRACYNEYLKQVQDWSDKHGGHFHVLNYAMHFDETTPHVHERSIMDVTDKFGHLVIAQEKALKQAGIELPDPSKPVSRYNNRKISFDKMRRELFQQICIKHGLNITVEPRPQRLRHKSTHDYKREQQAQTRAKDLQKQLGFSLEGR